MLKTVKIRSYGRGTPLPRRRVQGSARRRPATGSSTRWQGPGGGRFAAQSVVDHEKLDVIVRSGALKDRAVVLDLKDHQRALVWVDGRFSHVLPPGLYAYWTTFREVAVEVIDVPGRKGPLRA